jgi:hypothetical protein
MSNKNIKEINLDKRLDVLGKSLRQLSAEIYATNTDLASSLFTLVSFVHKMQQVHNTNNLDGQTVILNELQKAYSSVKELIN